MENGTSLEAQALALTVERRMDGFAILGAGFLVFFGGIVIVGAITKLLTKLLEVWRKNDHR